MTPTPADFYAARTFAGPDSTTLRYRLLTPKNYDSEQRYPLVLFLHGAGERGSDNLAQLEHGAPLFAQPDVREKYPCFVVAPQCPREQTWTDIDWKSEQPRQTEAPSPLMALVLGMVAAMQREFRIDPDRLYVTGMSMGGYGTWDVITRYPENWAAAAPICGGGDPAAAARAKAAPTWAFHGLKDEKVLPVRSQEMIAAVRAAGGRPRFTEYPHLAHDSWTAAYAEPEFLPWLFAQKRSPR